MSKEKSLIGHYLKSVSEFHETFDHPVLPSPQIPSQKRCELRVNLLQEELDEFKQAIKDNDIVAIADAFADLQYILSGAILEFGLQDAFKELFDEVHRSNMSKACKSVGEAKATVEMYESVEVPSYYRPRKSDYIVRRTSDDKLLKSISYSPAELKPIVEKWQ